MSEEMSPGEIIGIWLAGTLLAAFVIGAMSDGSEGSDLAVVMFPPLWPILLFAAIVIGSLFGTAAAGRWAVARVIGRIKSGAKR